MAIPIRSPEEIDAIDAVALSARAVLDAAIDACAAGASTSQIGLVVSEGIAASGGRAVFEGYPHESGGAAFAGPCCICVNEEVVHAPPGERVLVAGDLVTVDLGAVRGGWCADMARSVVVGGTDGERASRLAAGAVAATEAAIAAMAPGRRWSEAARAAIAAAESAGLVLAPGFGGHGIGRELHEEPSTGFDGGFLEPGSGRDFTLRPGMVLTVEPIVCEPVEGDAGPVAPGLVTLGDGWTVVTRGRTWACHEERMVAVAAEGIRRLGGASGVE